MYRISIIFAMLACMAQGQVAQGPGVTGGAASGGSSFPVASASAVNTGGSISPGALGQNVANQFWFPPGIPAPAVVASNAGSINGNPAFVGVTYNTALGETMLGTITSGAAITGSCTGGTCAYTVTAPTLASGFTGYTAYECESGSAVTFSPGFPPCTLKRVAGCANILTNCTITTSGAGANQPTVNTAWLQPTGVIATECPASVIPSMFGPDNVSGYHTVGGWEPNSNNSQTTGTWEICHRTWFNDEMTTPPFGHNAFVLIDHAAATGTNGPGNQDRSLWVGWQNSNVFAAAMYGGAAIQSEMDFWCAAGCSVTGGVDSEITDVSTNITDNAAINYSPAGGTNALRASVFKGGAGASNEYAALRGNLTFNNITMPAATKASVIKGSCFAGATAANLWCFGMQYTYATASVGLQAGIYFPNGTIGGSSNFGIWNANPGLTWLLNGPVTMSEIDGNAVAALPIKASTNTTGSVTVTQPTVSAPTGVACTTGASQYGYKFVGVDNNGGTVTSSETLSPSTCLNPLTSGNPATVSVGMTNTALSPFVRIDVYRTTGPMGLGKVGSLTCNTITGVTLGCSGFSDTGIAATGTLPTVNSTGTVSAYKLLTLSPCAAVGTSASPSVVSCGASTSGLFSCATTASGATCTVNTTAVNALSQIFITPSAADGANLSVTCNTTADSPTGPRLAAKVAGVSFTINLGTVAANPTCYEYTIVN